MSIQMENLLIWKDKIEIVLDGVPNTKKCSAENVVYADMTNVWMHFNFITKILLKKTLKYQTSFSEDYPMYRIKMFETNWINVC